MALDQLQANLAERPERGAPAAMPSLRVMGTPRRLVARVSGLAARQERPGARGQGPAARIAYDAQGNPTKAALGFARSQGVDVGVAAEARCIDGKEYVVAVIVRGGARRQRRPGRDPARRGRSALRFAKSMRWNASGVSFSRPLRWFVALLDDQVVPFEYAGVRSGRVSRGIRPLDSPELAIPAAADYERVMAEAGIMLDVREREAAASPRRRKPWPQRWVAMVPEDADLLREVANLVEYPLAIRGAFAQEYLRLPDVVLLAVMRKHQRYLPVMREGKLLPYFIAVANGAQPGCGRGALRQRGGAARPLRRRSLLLRCRHANAAGGVHRRAWARSPSRSSWARCWTRCSASSGWCPSWARLLGLSAAEMTMASRAAALCKSDLATQLVVELTSLQGRWAATMRGCPASRKAWRWPSRSTTCRASWETVCPQRWPAVVVGLADRLDTLVGLFAVGIRPSGAADPWGLRRAALGLVQALVGKEISLALPEAISPGRRAAACAGRAKPRCAMCWISSTSAIAATSWIAGSATIGWMPCLPNAATIPGWPIGRSES